MASSVANEKILINQLKIQKLEYELANHKKIWELANKTWAEKVNELQRDLAIQKENAKDLFDDLYSCENDYMDLTLKGAELGLMTYNEELEKWEFIENECKNKDVREKLEEWTWNIKQKISDQEYREVMSLLSQM